MTLPPFTRQGFWTRIVVFGAGLLLYVWIMRFMAREGSLIGIVLFSFLALLNLTRFIVTLWRRPSRRPR